MFKKSIKLDPHPMPPTVQEILEDVESFQHAEKSTVLRSVNNNGTADWWEKFQIFLKDVDNLHEILSELDSCKKKLEKTQTEMEEMAKNIQGNIDECLEKTRNSFANENDVVR